MDAGSATVDGRVKAYPVSRRAGKLPLHCFAVARFLQLPEHMLLRVVPEDRFAKDKAERHFVGQCFQRRGWFALSGKVRMSPSPEITMSVSAVVSLHAESHWITCEAPAIECNLAGEDGIRVWRARKTYPAFAAQSNAKCGTVAKIPGEMVPINIQSATARVLFDYMFTDSKVERSLTSLTETEFIR